MVRSLTVLGAALAVLSCSDGRTREHTEPDPYCGDGKKNAAEKCDGTDLGGDTCQSLGYLSGMLVCAGDCTFDALGCSRTCGNAAIDSGETCDGANVGGKDCTAWGSTSCDKECQLAQRCVDAPLVEAQRQGFRTEPSPRVAPRVQNGAKSVELFVVLASEDRVDIQRFDNDKGFLDDRVLAFDPGVLSARGTLVADLTGDGSADVAVASASEVLFKVSGATAFSTQTLTISCGGSPSVRQASSGELLVVCSDGAATWLVPVRYASGAFEAAQRVDLEDALFQSIDATGDGKADLLVHTAAGSIKVLEGDGALGFAFKGKEWAKGQVPGAFVALDADGDGRLDLLVRGSGLLLQQADGSFKAQALDVFGLPVDLDGDGRIDVVSLTASKLRLLRNTAGLDFSRVQEIDTALVSVGELQVGDVQVDGDPDLVVSGPSSDGKYQVVWYRNQAR